MWSFEHWLIGTFWPLSKAYLHEALSLTVPIIRIKTFSFASLVLVQFFSSFPEYSAAQQRANVQDEHLAARTSDEILSPGPVLHADSDITKATERKISTAFPQTTYSQLKMIKPKLFVWYRVLELKDMQRDPLVGKKATVLLACKIKFPFREKLAALFIT